MRYLTLNIILFTTFLLAQSTLLAQEHLTHGIWDELTKKYVTEEGKVNYKGFQKEEARLDEYLKVLSANHPDKSWNRNQRLAYWINAYNAFTVKLIVKNYPIKSIKELGGGIYKVNTPWDIKFIKIGDKTYDLNNIEHGIIRKEFKEPRIHFAINCAAVSCPKLRNEAYFPDRLDAQLDDQAIFFINNSPKNNITSEEAQLSKIFSWFRGDFKKKYPSIMAFINKYSTVKIEKKTKISYLEYDWNLNE
ncbi:MAG: DUF547 domain-containing protein [Flavobacteriales bacterium]|nr:DUF547 domain-containing protein [Flavobacteriales bacterium]